MASNQQPSAPPAFSLVVNAGSPAVASAVAAGLPPAQSASAAPPRGFPVRTTSSAPPGAPLAVPPARNQQSTSPFAAVPIAAASILAIARPPPPSSDRLTSVNLVRLGRENQSSMPSGPDLSFLTPVRAVEILKWVNEVEAGWAEEGVNSWWSL